MSKLGRYKKAVVAYDEAIKINPSFIDAWVGMGAALGNMGHYNESVEAFDKAIGINPQLNEAWYGKYLALQHLKRSDEAARISDKVIAIKQTLAHAALPASSSTSGNFLVPVKEDVVVYLLKAGSEFYKNENFGDAAKCYQKTIEINPLISEAWFGSRAKRRHCGNQRGSQAVAGLW